MSAEGNFSTTCGFFQAFGLLYFSIRKLSSESVKGYPSIGYTIHFFLLFIILTTQMVILVIIVSEQTQESLNAKNALNYVMQHSVFILLILILWVAFIQSYAATPKFKKIFANFLEISKLCRCDFQHTIDYKEVKYCIFKILIMTSVAHLLIQTGLVLLEMRLKSINVIFNAIITTLPVSFLAMITVKYNFFVQTVNCVLKEMIVVVEKVFFKYNSTAGMVCMSKGENFDTKIKSLRKILNLVVENVSLINDSLGCTMLIYLFMIVMSLITGGYRTFLMLVGKFPLENCGGAVIAFSESLMGLYLLVYPCNSTEKTLAKLQLTLNRIECELDLKSSTVEALRSLNTQLSLQPIQFTIAGYYTINLPFLAGIFTGIASYLIILVQFYTS